MESMDWRRVKPIQSWECSSCSSLYALHLNCMSCVSLNAIDESASLAVDKSVSNKKTFCNLAPDRFVWFSFAWTSLISSNEDETRLASSNVQRFRSIVLPSVKDISAPVRFEEVNCTSYKKAFFITILDRSLPRTAPSPFWPQKSPTLVIAHYSFPSLLEWPPVDPLSKMRALPPAVYEMNQIHQRSIEGIHPIY